MKRALALVCLFLLLSPQRTFAQVNFEPAVRKNTVAQKANNVRKADAFGSTSSNAYDRITLAIANLPAGGGIVDATGLEGAQSITSTISSTKPVHLLLGAATYSCSAGSYCFNLLAGSHIEGIGGASVVNVSAGRDGVNANSFTTISNFTLVGPGTASNTFSAIDSGGTTRVSIRHMRIEDWGTHCINTGGGSTYWSVTHNLIQDCIENGILNGAGSTDNDYSHNTILNVEANAIDLNGSRNTVVGNNIKGAGPGGGAVDKWGILATPAGIYNADDNTIAYNTVDGSGAQNIIIKAAPGLTANRNNIIGNTSINALNGNGSCICVDGSSAGTIAGTKILGNITGGCAIQGVVVDGSVATVTDTQVENNWLIGNTGGAYVDTGTRTRVVGNVETIADAIYRIRTAMLVTGPLFVGTAPAGAISAGIGMTKENGIYWRNQANDADLLGIQMGNGGANELILRGGGGTSSIRFESSNGTLRMNMTEAGVFTLQGSGMLGFAGVAFAALGAPANGTFVFCADCTIANPCAGGGGGALAKRLGGGWVCN